MERETGLDKYPTLDDFCDARCEGCKRFLVVCQKIKVMLISDMLEVTIE